MGQNDIAYVDQRGQGFTRIVDGDSVAGARLDIGAFEASNNNQLVVTTVDDESDANFAANDLSLREAILLATSTAGPDTISFSPDLFTTDPLGRSKITLGSSLVIGTSSAPLRGNLTIDGSALEDLVIDGNSVAWNILYLEYGSDDLLVHDLALTGATVNGLQKSSPFGSIDVTLDRVRVYDNGGTGIVYSYSGSLTIRDSEVSDNGAGVQVTFASLNMSGTTVADNAGTGIVSGYGGATIVNSTISQNASSSPNGAGLSVTFGTAYVTNVTVAFNRADKNNSGTSSGTGGVYAGDAGTINLKNTIVAENFAGQAGPSEVRVDIGRKSSGPYTGTLTGMHCLIGYDPVLSNGIDNNDANGNLVGETLSTVIDPRLTDLNYHGGLTRTHALKSDSLAIDAGDNSVAPSGFFDQRGRWRKIDWFDDDIGSPIDIGAVELAVVELYADE